MRATVQNIAVGGSPFIYRNTSDYLGQVFITGAGVQAVAFSRDGVTYYGLGGNGGEDSHEAMFWLAPYDYLKVTYSNAPTMVFIPMIFAMMLY